MTDTNLFIKMLIVFFIFTSPCWIMLGYCGFVCISDSDANFALNDDADTIVYGYANTTDIICGITGIVGLAILICGLVLVLKG